MTRQIDTTHAIARTSVPAMDALLGHAYPVLDHGFIRVIDYMGDDAAIVQAARVSYGAGTKAVSTDEGLIRYLMRHWHSTPFEMCEIKLHVKLPVFVARQWIRHRTACLAGDVRVSFDLPGGIKSRGHQHNTLTIKEIYDRFQPTENRTRPDKQKNPYFKRDRVMGMRLRSCNEDSMTTAHTRVTDIWQSGVKPVIRVDFPNGVLRASKDHMCLTDAGWLKLADALAQGVRFATWGRNDGFISEPVVIDAAAETWRTYPDNSAYEISDKGRVRRGARIKTPTITPAGYQVVSLSENSVSRARFVHHLVLETFSTEVRGERETRHIDGNRQHNAIENLTWGTKSENAADRMTSGSDQTLSIQWAAPLRWQEDGEEMTYDMEVAGPYHNFVAGSVIVHNSVNEYSARYSILDREFYIPAPEHVAKQSTINNQGRGEPVDAHSAQWVRDLLTHDSITAYDDYERMMKPVEDGGPGIARELARINLPTSIYTQWYWKTDLHNLFHFLRLRADPHAQYEIRAYAEVLCALVEQWVPMAYRAWQSYQHKAVTFSAEELSALRGMLDAAGIHVSDQDWLRDLGLSRREIDEFMRKLGQ